MAVQDYQVTALGNRKIIHNGLLSNVNRKLSLDPAATATAALLKAGYISTTITAPNYEGDAANKTTYTVQAAGAGKLLHSTGLAAGTVPLGNAATLQLDPADPNTATLLARGWIV